jgi:hypothetical protein
VAPDLPAPPPSYAETRDALHRIARYAVIPFRRRVDGETWLVPAPGGFGTPLLADGSRARVEGPSLLLERAGREVSAPITTLAAACDLLGAAPEQALEKPDIPGIGDPDESLRCDPQAVAFLASWFALGWEALGELRHDGASVDATELRLWSHHFDPSFECHSDAQGRRASYGFSPGDRGVPQPYVYVAPWQFDRAPRTGFWNATTFRGAVLPLSELVAAGDPRAAAVAFLRTGRDILAGS